ncbi:flavin reductase (plasmid) [Diaphorobacter sp. HDW4B]|uniref:flavin reductase n=1 Tax=Diaphorobacter sp. HDW4B TaxID=2714925 RepID=UPI001409FC9E|nr:flavin reductase [Diaphorobacter sp. HDW4B]QIL73809.1 flavin reductase [Diaphorobacter sp. HDW4B]
MNFDSKHLRQVLGAFPTGVTVVTTIDAGGNPFGVTANSFSSVSLDPPLILWSQANTSSSHPAFRDADRFVVNIMADDQIPIANQFAKSGVDKFAGVKVSPGIGGLPVIDGSAAHLQCRKVAAYPGGDHTIFIGMIEHMERSTRNPLAFGQGRYMVTFAHDLGGHVSQDAQPANLSTIQAVRLASAALPEICEEIGQRTLGIAVWGNHGPTLVRWEPSKNPVSPNLQTGVVVNLTQSATGMAFTAFMNTEQVRRSVDEELAIRRTSGNLDLADFEARLADARKHGLARSVGKAPSDRHQITVNAFSAPVFDANGDMAIVLSTTCAADRLTPDWEGDVPQALLGAAKRLSGMLGAKPS